MKFQHFQLSGHLFKGFFLKFIIHSINYKAYRLQKVQFLFPYFLLLFFKQNFIISFSSFYFKKIIFLFSK
jgi:hypothetical protein